MHSLSGKLTIVLFLFINTFPEKGCGQSDSGAVPLSRVWRDFDTNLLGSFTYNYGLNHATGIVGTYAIIQSDLDWEIYKFAHRHTSVQWAGFPSVVVGGLVPLVVPLSLYYHGKSTRNVRLQNTSLALGQAAVLGWLISSSYKAITARKPPEAFESKIGRKNFSDDFKWGFMRRGIFDGWPSGHTTTAFAMATTLRELYPENEKLRTYALVYAFAIGIGISTNIHWMSDAFAGAFMGYAIGKSVGSSFGPKGKRQASGMRVYAAPSMIGFSISL